MKPSPGPWTLNKYGTLLDAEGNLVPIQGASLPGGFVGEDDVSIANRNLVVQAPTLLEVLKDLVRLIEQDEDSVGDEVYLYALEGLDKARDIIAKVTGDTL